MDGGLKVPERRVVATVEVRRFVNFQSRSMRFRLGEYDCRHKNLILTCQIDLARFCFVCCARASSGCSQGRSNRRDAWTLPLQAKRPLRLRSRQPRTTRADLCAIWFFRKSRDLWKSKYQALKASVKQLKNRVADLTKSREQWKLKAEQADSQLAALEAEILSLHAKVEALASEKKTIKAAAR